MLNTWPRRNKILAMMRDNISREDIATKLNIPLLEVQNTIDEYIIVRKCFQSDTEYQLWKRGMDLLYILHNMHNLTPADIKQRKEKLLQWFLKPISHLHKTKS